MSNIKESKAYQYATFCIDENNKKVGNYIKKQAGNWLKIVEGKVDNIYVCEKTYTKINKLLKIIVHPDLNKNLYESMEDYANLLIIATFCTKQKNGDRYYQTIVLEIARKNFKTFYSAVIFILGMLTEPQFSRFFSVAPSAALSNELKIAIRKIIKSSPLLDPYFKVNKDVILCKINQTEYRPLAYSKDKLDGKLANIFLADEAGALDAYPLEAMRSSQIHLKNKLGIIISTQYPNNFNVFQDELDLSKKVLDGLVEDRRFSLLYEPDAKLEKSWFNNDLVLYQANPTIFNNPAAKKDLVAKRELASMYENKKENFLCKHLNIKFSGLGAESFIEIDKVKLCRDKISKNFWKDKKIYVGLDLSLTNDNTAVAIVTKDIYTGIVYAKCLGFVPKNRIDFKIQRERVNYKNLIKKGDCIACGDEIIDYFEVEQKIIDLKVILGVEVQQVGYDRYNAISSIQKLSNEGFECVEIKQHSSVLHSPTKWLQELILTKKFRYDKNELLEINFQNARLVEDTNRNKYINKKKSNGKIDMVVALINALYLLQQNEIYGDDDFGAQFI